MVAKCGDTTSPDVQLAVVRALLTITTAEHFRAHGDCLVQVLLESGPGAAGVGAGAVHSDAATAGVCLLLLSCCCCINHYGAS